MPAKIWISDHMFLYNICSAYKYEKNKVSHDPIVQIWFFHIIAWFTPFTVRNTPFMGKIFILDHMFQYDICSACQYEKNDVSHDPVVQIWFFHVIAWVTPFTVRNTHFMGKIFILDHMFLYNICSACKYETNKVSHDPIVQICFFLCNSLGVPHLR